MTVITQLTKGGAGTSQGGGGGHGRGRTGRGGGGHGRGRTERGGGTGGEGPGGGKLDGCIMHQVHTSTNGGCKLSCF